MTPEYIDRTITEIGKLTQWPRLAAVKEIMQRVAAEMEAEAMATPIAQAVEAAPAEVAQVAEVVEGEAEHAQAAVDEVLGEKPAAEPAPAAQ